MDALGGQLLCSLSRVGAEKPHVFNAVAPGVFLCVLDGLGDHFHADGLPGGPGQTQGDGAGAAVEIQYRLCAVEIRQSQSLSVQDLRLMVVDLVKGGGTQPEPQRAQLVFNESVAPESVIGFAQDHVVRPGVDVVDHGGDGGDCRPQRLDQLLPLGQSLAVCRDTDHHRSGDGGLSDKNVTDVPGAGGLVIGENVILRHPFQHRLGDQRRLLRLDQAAGHGDQIMAPGAEKARGGTVLRHGHRKLDLVAVALAGGRGGDGQGLRIYAADAAERVGDPPALELHLQGVVHVHEVAAAALPEVGARRRHPMGRRLQDLLQPSVDGGLCDLDDPNGTDLSGNGALDKDRPVLDPGHAQALAGAAGDPGGEDLIFLHDAPPV